MKNNNEKTSFEKAMEYVNQFEKINMSKINTNGEWTKQDELENEEILKEIKNGIKNGDIVTLCEDNKGVNNMNHNQKETFKKAMEYAKRNFKDLEEDMSKIPDIDENQTDEELEKELEELNKNFEKWLQDGIIIYKGR